MKISASADYDAAQADPRKPGRPPKEREAAIGHIHIRITLRRKSAYVRAAGGAKLTDWIFAHLDGAAGYCPPH